MTNGQGGSRPTRMTHISKGRPELPSGVYPDSSRSTSSTSTRPSSFPFRSEGNPTLHSKDAAAYFQFRLASNAGKGIVDLSDIDVGHCVCVDDEPFEVVAFHEVAVVSFEKDVEKDSREDLEDGFVLL